METVDHKVSEANQSEVVQSTSTQSPESENPSNEAPSNSGTSRKRPGRGDTRSSQKKKRSASSSDSKSKPKAKKKKTKSARKSRPNYTIEEGEDMLLIISNVSHSDSVWKPKRKGKKKLKKKPAKTKAQSKSPKTKKKKTVVGGTPARCSVIVDSQSTDVDPKAHVQPQACSSSSSEDDQWGQGLPVEVLVNIFQYVVRRDGAVPFLCRTARVCRLWNVAASSPGLWRSVTVGFCWIEPGKSQLPRTEMRIQNTMSWLAQNRLSQLREFSLCHWKKNVDYALQAVSECCPHLISLKLSHCTGVTDKAFQSLATHCHKLESIDVQNTDVQGEGLVTFLETHGHHIQKISFSHGSKSEKILTVISKGCCPELRSLAINTTLNTGFSQQAVCIPALQIGCPKLQTFSMMNVMLRPKMIRNAPACGPGFPLLEELCIATTSISFFSDQDLHSLLHSSPRLRVLDLRGCSRVTPTTLFALPCQDLECLFWGLYFNSTSAASSKKGLHLLAQKWSRTLRELDITNHAFSEEDLEVALGHLAVGEGAHALRLLNLSGTKVTSQALRMLIGHAVALDYLNLSSCRYLPRGMKKLYRGQEDIRQLLDKLE